MGEPVALARRTITLDTGRRKVEAPVDLLGRERWRTRMDDQRIEVRADGGQTAAFYGHAAVFNKRTWIGPTRWGFWEQVAPGAFDKTIGEADVRFLVNHDPNLLLARNKSGTLSLSVDDTGLVTEAASLDRRQSYTNDVVIALERNDITQMSFAFETVRESWEILGDDTELRTLEEVRLWDVSVVTYPAYEETDAGLRSATLEGIFREAGLTADQQRALISRFSGVDLTPDTPQPGSSSEVDTSQPGSSTGAPLALTRRRHDALAAFHGLRDV